MVCVCVCVWEKGGILNWERKHRRLFVRSKHRLCKNNPVNEELFLRTVSKEQGRDDVLEELAALADEEGRVMRGVGILRAADVYWNSARQPVLISIINYGEEPRWPAGDSPRIVLRPGGR
jgi:hypothetical protein